MYTILAYLVGSFIFLAYVILTRKEGKLQAQLLWAKCRKKTLTKVLFFGQDKTLRTHYLFADTEKSTVNIQKKPYIFSPAKIVPDGDRNLGTITINGAMGETLDIYGAKSIKTKCPHCEKRMEVDIPELVGSANPIFTLATVEIARLAGIKSIEKEQKRVMQLMYVAAGAAVGALVFSFIVMNNQSALVAAVSRLEGVITALGSGVVI